MDTAAVHPALPYADLRRCVSHGTNRPVGLPYSTAPASVMTTRSTQMAF